MCFHKIFLSFYTIYWVMISIPFVSQGICYQNSSLSSVSLSFPTLLDCLLSSQTHLAIFFNLTKPEQRTNHNLSSIPHCQAAAPLIYSSLEQMPQYVLYICYLSSSSILSSTQASHLHSPKLLWKNYSMVNETSSCHTEWRILRWFPSFSHTSTGHHWPSSPLNSSLTLTLREPCISFPFKPISSPFQYPFPITPFFLGFRFLKCPLTKSSELFCLHTQFLGVHAHPLALNIISVLMQCKYVSDAFQMCVSTLNLFFLSIELIYPTI